MLISDLIAASRIDLILDLGCLIESFKISDDWVFALFCFLVNFISKLSYILYLALCSYCFFLVLSLCAVFSVSYN